MVSKAQDGRDTCILIHADAWQNTILESNHLSVKNKLKKKEDRAKMDLVNT